MTGTPDADDYASKLVKYIPGEVLAFFLPATALAAADTGLQWAALAIGLVATAGYLYVYNRRNNLPAPRPLYVALSGLAFLAWAFGTSAPTRGLIGLPDIYAQFVLLVAVLGIPMFEP